MGLLAGGVALAEEPAPAESPDDDTAAPRLKEDDAAPPTIGGQVHVRYKRSNLATQPSAGEIELARAKIEIEWQPRKRIDAVIAADVSPAAKEGGGAVVPLDVYVQTDLAKWLRVRAGHRKAPFSGLRLQSLATMPTVSRGEYAHQLDNLFHDEGSADLAREVGVDLRLRAKSLSRMKLDVGLSQGEDGPKDVAARVTVEPADWLEVGASTAVIHVFPSAGSQAPSQARALGEADAAIEPTGWASGWHAEVEVATGDDDRPRGDHWFLAGYVLLSYRLAFGPEKTPAIEPLLRCDFVDRSRGVSDDHAVALTAGLNFYPRKYLRLMADLERAQRAAAYGSPDETRVLVQLAFDI